MSLEGNTIPINKTHVLISRLGHEARKMSAPLTAASQPYVLICKLKQGVGKQKLGEGTFSQTYPDPQIREQSRKAAALEV